MLSIVVLLTKKRYSNFLKPLRFSENLFQSWRIEIVQNFQWLPHKSMLISQMEGYFENPILKEPMLFLLALKWNLYKKAFSCVKTKTNFCCKPCWNAERSNHSFLSNWWITFFKHLYSLIMWQYKSIEINWLCKHRKKVISSQACISINSCTESSKTKFFLDC